MPAGQQSNTEYITGGDSGGPIFLSQGPYNGTMGGYVIGTGEATFLNSAHDRVADNFTTTLTTGNTFWLSAALSQPPSVESGPGRWYGEDSPTAGPDGDYVDSIEDNCDFDDNPDQKDSDHDGIGDVCDPCPASQAPTDDANLESELSNFDDVVHDYGPLTAANAADPTFVTNRAKHYRGEVCEQNVALARTPGELVNELYTANAPSCGPASLCVSQSRIEYDAILGPGTFGSSQSPPYGFRFCKCTATTDLTTVLGRKACDGGLTGATQCPFVGRKGPLANQPPGYFASLSPAAVIGGDGAGLVVRGRIVVGGSAPIRAAVGPPAFTHFGIVGQATKDRVLLFGGADASGATNPDLWVYQVAASNWTHSPLVGPAFPERVLAATYHYGDDATYIVDETGKGASQKARILRLRRGGIVDVVGSWPRVGHADVTLSNGAGGELLLSFSKAGAHAIAVLEVREDGSLAPTLWTVGVGALAAAPAITAAWLTKAVELPPGHLEVQEIQRRDLHTTPAFLGEGWW